VEDSDGAPIGERERVAGKGLYHKRVRFGKAPFNFALG
jgi:hypothetical protein